MDFCSANKLVMYCERRGGWRTHVGRQQLFKARYEVEFLSVDLCWANKSVKYRKQIGKVRCLTLFVAARIDLVGTGIFASPGS